MAFFVGCLVDKVFPDIAFSVMRSLEFFKAKVSVPPVQGCCGIPALAAGDSDTFERLVAHNVALFDAGEIDYLVTACATCAATIVKWWPVLIKNSALNEKVCLLSEKTVDINWLLARRYNLSNLGKKQDSKENVTYHDPCHLKKSLDIADEPRRVIEASGYRLKEMDDSDTCCGMGGSFNLKHYDLSSEIGKKKAGSIIETGASILATSCPACMMQLSDMLAKANADVRVCHPVQLFSGSLDSGD